MAVAFLMGASCSHRQIDVQTQVAPLEESTIYLSSDRDSVAVFTATTARFGPTDLTLLNPAWPSSRASYFETAEKIQCVSLGVSDSIEYAIKRPIKLADSYQCLNTSFKVLRCFDDCRAAVIETSRTVPGHQGEVLKGSMYVDSCLGVVVLSNVSDISGGIPLSAEWLRGPVGILADKSYPKCRSF